MDAYDLIIGICAFNSRFRGEFYLRDLYQKIIDNASNIIVKGTGIRPHPFHNDSTKLHDAFYQLIRNGVFKQWVPGNYLTWNFPLSQREYFNERIKPGLKKEELKGLEALAISMA